jgi:hypothetical protein
MKLLLRPAFFGVLVLSLGSAAAGQTPALGVVMREKLTHSQRILGAIVTSDYVTLQREAVALARATERPAWSVLKTPEYLQQSDAFLQAVTALVKAANERNLDAAANSYVSLTMSCVQCHRYIARSRIASEHPG